MAETFPPTCPRCGAGPAARAPDPADAYALCRCCGEDLYRVDASSMMVDAEAVLYDHHWTELDRVRRER